MTEQTKISPGELRARLSRLERLSPMARLSPQERLSPLEKKAIKRMIDRDQPLPEHYRSVLFAGRDGPELVWPGKDGEFSPVAGAYRVLERFQPPQGGQRARAEAPSGSAPAGADRWRNKLFWADNLEVLAALAEAPLRREIEAAGGIRLIYIDPPFDVGADFDCTLPIGENQAGGPAHQVKAMAYRDSWGQGEASYLSMMYGRLRLMRDLLAEDGSLYLHCDWRSCSALRLLLDEIFGRECFVNGIVWHYYNKYSAATRCLPRAHDTIWVYSKSGKHVLNALRQPREAPQRQLVRENVGGVLKNARDAQGRLRYRTVTDKKGDDVWRIPQLQPASAQWSGYGTQKHHDLLERIILTGSNPGDLVADFFCGSGTTLATAQRLGRKWIGCDEGQPAIHTTRKRLLSPPAAAPPAAGSSGQRTTDSAQGGLWPAPFDLLAPAAVPGKITAGTRGVGTARGMAAGHSTAPEAALPTIQADFTVNARLDGLSVSVALTDFRVRQGKSAQTAGGLTVRKGRLVEVKAGKGGGTSETVLTQSWRDWVDYWAVDFQYGDVAMARRPGEASAPFAPHSWSFRTYKSRSLDFGGAAFTYARPGDYLIAVQVIDVFGNAWLKSQLLVVR